jgi:hypothetical protein
VLCVQTVNVREGNSFLGFIKLSLRNDFFPAASTTQGRSALLQSDHTAPVPELELEKGRVINIV